MTVSNKTTIDSDINKLIKDKSNELAAIIEENIEPGRRRSIALTKLEEFSMWAVKSASIGDK